VITKLQYIEQMKREELNLIILQKEKRLYQSAREGMLPLYQAITDLGIPQLKNTIIVDKIVGKAAALLISYIHAQTVYCSLLSSRGKTVLENHGITFFHEELTPEIINRYGTDICPFEKAVLDVEDPKIGYLRIQAKLQQLGLLDPEL
jgi:hypothetical protein